MYEEFEPLRFTMREAAEAAYFRILSLAYSTKRGDLMPGSGWFSREGYYYRSTVYRLLIPSAIFRMMQQKLTVVDLSVDSAIASVYGLAKMAYAIWTESFVLAQITPALEYDPHKRDDISRQDSRASKNVQQGLPSGYLDRSIDALIVREKGEPARLMNYGEFEADFRVPGSITQKANVVLREGLIDFHPASRPVLWRLLFTQAIVYRALMENSIDEHSLSRILSSVGTVAWDWRLTGSREAEMKIHDVPVAVASEYFKTRDSLQRQTA
jgi:hypothetical protein